jgi:hypothetical protein
VGAHRSLLRDGRRTLHRPDVDRGLPWYGRVDGNGSLRWNKRLIRIATGPRRSSREIPGDIAPGLGGRVGPSVLFSWERKETRLVLLLGWHGGRRYGWLLRRCRRWGYRGAVVVKHASPGRQRLWWVAESGWYPSHPGSRPNGGDGWREVSTCKVVVDDTIEKAG